MRVKETHLVPLNKGGLGCKSNRKPLFIGGREVAQSNKHLVTFLAELVEDATTYKQPKLTPDFNRNQ
jgi:hypothetical protein